MTASPIHCGAMTRDWLLIETVRKAPSLPCRRKARAPRQRNEGASMAPAEVLALAQLVDRAAIRALRRTALRDIEVHARVAVPQLHVGLGAGAEDAAVAVEVLGDEL